MKKCIRRCALIIPLFFLFCTVSIAAVTVHPPPQAAILPAKETQAIWAGFGQDKSGHLKLSQKSVAGKIAPSKGRKFSPGERLLAAFGGQELKYNIAVILPLTGPGASLGEAVRDGIQTAYDRLDPDLKGRLNLIFEDDGSQSSKAVAALEKIRSENSLAGVISALSNSSKALVPLTERYGLGLIAIAIDPSIAEGAARTVVLWSSIKEQGNLLVNEAVKRGYRKIALVNTIHQGNISMRDAFLNAAQGRLEVALRGEFNVGDTDFRSFITRIRQEKDLDGIALFLHFGHLGLFAKQVRAAGIKLPLFGMNFQDSGAIRDSEGALDNQWFVHLVDADDAFIREYTSRFPGASLFGAANGNDALLLYARALKENVNPGQTGHFLQNVRDFHGSMGTYSAEPDHLFSIPSVIKVVKAPSGGPVTFEVSK